MENLEWYLFSGYAPYFAILLLGAFLFVGWAFGKYFSKKKTRDDLYINASYQTAIFGLIALVIGFTFASAIGHYDVRKEKVRMESSAIFNAYRNAIYLQAGDSERLRELLNQFLSLRLDIFNNVHSFAELDKKAIDIDNSTRRITLFTFEAIERAPDKTRALANEFLKPQVDSLEKSVHEARLLLVARPEPIIFSVLFLFLAIAGFVGGYEMAGKKKLDWIFTGVYILVVYATLRVIFLLEFPDLNPDQQVRYNKELLQLNSEMPHQN